MKEINLLPIQRQNFFQRNQVLRAAQIIGYGSFILSLTAVLILFFLGQNTDIPKLQTQQKSLETNLQLLADKQTQYLFLTDRVQRIQTIVKKRNDFAAILSQIQSLIPDLVSVQGLSLDNKKISLVVSSDSLPAIGQFIDGFTQAVKKKQIVKHVTFDDVLANPVKGNYTVSMQGELL